MPDDDGALPDLCLREKISDDGRDVYARKDRKGPDDTLCFDDSYILLSTLYVYGEHFMNSAIQNAAIRETLRLTQIKCDEGLHWYPMGHSVKIIYLGTPEGSPARRLMVDLHLKSGHEGWISLKCEPAFMVDLLKAFYEKKNATKEGKARAPQESKVLIPEDYFE